MPALISLVWMASCGGGPSGATAEPSVRLVYGARGEGEIEPCGCPKNPRGGLSRRNAKLDELRERGPVVVVDAGLSLHRAGALPPSAGELEQRRLKASLIASAWPLGGIDGMALSGDDWRLGTAFVRDLVEQHQLPVIAANLMCDGEAPYPPGRVIEAGGRRIGIVGVTTGEVDGCEVGDLRQSLTAAVATLGAVDLVVGLVPLQSAGELSQLTAAGPLPLDLVVDARPRTPSAGADMRGGVPFLGAGVEGKSLGVVGLWFGRPGDPWQAVEAVSALEHDLAGLVERRDRVVDRMAGANDADRTALIAQRDAFDVQIATKEEALSSARSSATGNRFSVSQADLDPTVPDHAATLALVTAAKRQLAMAGGEDPRKFVPRIVAEGPYAGGEVCVPCHQEQHLQWSRTGHARAWQGLVQLDRALDHDCWSCHVTGAMQAGGPQSATQTSGFRDVQCEACHGPGRAHAASPEAVRASRDPGEALCRGCHDGVRDEGRFDYRTYRPKIVHPSASPGDP